MGLTKTQIAVLSELVKNRCEICGAEHILLIPHRIRRGNQGGQYIPRNIEMLCELCHKKVHYKEEGCRKR
jgi:hypothetical protein